MKKVLYSAVVLIKKSSDELVNELINVIPSDFKIYAHHMTINLGEIDKEYEEFLGASTTLIATEIGFSDMAIAVKVIGFPSKNKIPHITVAVNVKEGGKPKMSNNIVDWRSLSSVIGKDKIYLIGNVKEIYGN